MTILANSFKEIWGVDFEFHVSDDGLPRPLCMAAVELRSGRRILLWRDELLAMREPPFSCGADTLVLAYYASAEIGCFLSLGWGLPVNLIDLYAEFRNLTNGLALPSGRGLPGGMSFFGLNFTDAIAKDAMRQLILSREDFSDDERLRILGYCADDADACIQLSGKMDDNLTGHSLLRGEYMKALAAVERNGIPVDAETYSTLVSRWDSIKSDIIREVDREYGLYDGSTFKSGRFAAWCNASGIAWPTLDGGQPALDDDTFRKMATRHPRLWPLRELRATLSQFRTLELPVGPDGRNRCMLSAFASVTSRNQPSTSKFLFGQSVWLRSLIQAPPGWATAYIDWGQQEFGIAAALSGDTAMQEAYLSGDPYLGFAKLAGAVPADATKTSHPAVRERFKVATLAVQYCMLEHGLAGTLGVTLIEARGLLAAHRRCFPRFWEWSSAAVDYAMLGGRIHTVFGWRMHATSATNPRTLRNYPMQGNGAEMMRLACIFGIKRGVKICAPVHDAFLIEAPLDGLDDAVAAMQAAMDDASAAVLGGFRLRSDVKVFRHPERFTDPRGVVMWETVMRLLGRGTEYYWQDGLTPCKVA